MAPTLSRKSTRNANGEYGLKKECRAWRIAHSNAATYTTTPVRYIVSEEALLQEHTGATAVTEHISATEPPERLDTNSSFSCL